LSSKKLKKITKDGPYGGKNRQILGMDGRALTEIEALKEDARLKGDKLGLTDEQEAIKQSKAEKLAGKESYLDRVKRKMQENEEKDEEVRVSKLKEKRIKKKRRTKGDRKKEDNDDEEGVQLASQSGSEEYEYT